MAFKEDWNYRTRLPWWLKDAVKQAIKRGDLVRPEWIGTLGVWNSLAVLKGDRRWHELLDHCGSDKARELLIAEPYKHKKKAIPAMADSLAVLLGCDWDWRPGENQWHKDTLRIVFFQRSE